MSSRSEQRKSQILKMTWSQFLYTSYMLSMSYDLEMKYDFINP